MDREDIELKHGSHWDVLQKIRALISHGVALPVVYADYLMTDYDKVKSLLDARDWELSNLRDDLKAKLREVPWTEKEVRTKVDWYSRDSNIRDSFLQGVLWAEKRIKERVL